MKMRRITAVAAVAVAGALVAGCGGSGGGPSAGSTSTGTSDNGGHATSTYAGGVITPQRAAPPLTGTDIAGRTVDIRNLRGHPVLVTFVYAHCPDVCPMIMSNLRQVRRLSPLGRNLRVIAVSVDPKGDTPAVVRRFLKSRGVASFVDYVVGSRAQLEPIWSDWQVATRVAKDNPELVEHSALIYGVTSRGQLATAYPVGFQPKDIARDLPLLAKS